MKDDISGKMFDLRPTKETGDLDLEQIKKVRDFLDLREERWSRKKTSKNVKKNNLGGRPKQKKLISNPSEPSFNQIISLEILEKALNQIAPPDPEEKSFGPIEIFYPARQEIIKIFEEMAVSEQNNSKNKEEEISDAFVQEIFAGDEKETSSVIPGLPRPSVASSEGRTRDPNSKSDLDSRWSSSRTLMRDGNDTEDISVAKPQGIVNFDFKYQETVFPKTFNRALLTFASAGLMVLIVISGLALASRGFSAKNNVLSSALEAYQAMLQAKNSAQNLDFSGAQISFQSASQNFLQAEQEINGLGGVLVAVLAKIPLTSQVGSAEALVRAGEKIAQAGWNFAEVGNFLTGKNIDFFGGNESLTKKISGIQRKIKAAGSALAEADKNLANVKSADLPANFVSAVNDLKEKMPLLLKATQGLENWSEVALNVLGERRAKKYLLVFQNPSEARATGGFIGTYGVLDLDQGKIKNLAIDGVFNLDGQLLEKIIPPAPIQKISTAWSMHDANWFADFATSAQKMMWFLEKGGGETVDGVISLTPAVVEKLLAVTGPVDLPQYQTTLAADNFLDAVQYKVEADYDKSLNQPKKILADFAPLFLAKIEAASQDKSRDILNVLAEALAQKDILFYFSDSALQKTFTTQGWSGEILATDKDYLNVINTNINGFKTDKMIDQKISLQTEIQSDGSLIDTVKITRTHNGGQTPYDWYNQVNSDYLRVYVPLGSQLISARGQTLEINKAPIDYQKQGFKTDANVAAQEQGLKIDPDSGTQIFEESGKTVFGNWVYVSPGKTVEITYQYLLPFKINYQAEDAVWGLLVQKQAGSKISSLETAITFPENPKIKWQYPETLKIDGNTIKFSGELEKDKLLGVVLTR